jgi:phosphate transport system permease protein
MKFDRAVRRKVFSHGMTVATGLAIVVIMIPLASVIYEAILLGGPVFNLAFFTQTFPFPCSPRAGVTCHQGGVVYAIQGTFILLGLSSLFSVPVGVGAAIFAVEYRNVRGVARVVATAADVLAGVPSIVVGVFVYVLILYYYPLLVFSTLSGSLALAVIMVPIVTRTTEEALKIVPNSVREAALALGISRWKTSVRIVLVAALPGVLTGVLLSMARSLGEAAPLLILDNSLLPYTGIDHPSAVVPIMIYTFATTPYQNWINLAWGGALFLLVLVLGLSLASRLVLRRLARRMRGE